MVKTNSLVVRLSKVVLASDLCLGCSTEKEEPDEHVRAWVEEEVLRGRGQLRFPIALPLPKAFALRGLRGT